MSKLTAGVARVAVHSSLRPATRRCRPEPGLAEGIEIDDRAGAVLDDGGKQVAIVAIALFFAGADSGQGQPCASVQTLTVIPPKAFS